MTTIKTLTREHPEFGRIIALREEVSHASINRLRDFRITLISAAVTGKITRGDRDGAFRKQFAYQPA
jgi:hypothetical protein